MISRCDSRLVPHAAVRDGEGRTLHPAAVSGILLGMATRFATGLLVSV